MRNRVIFLLTVLCLAGCMPQQKEVIAYSGAPRSSDSLAMLKPQLFVIVLSIDGDDSKRIVSLGAFHNSDTTIYLEPGAHQLKLAYRSPTKYSRAIVDMDIYVSAGHRYLLVADLGGFIRKSYYWPPVLEDMTSTPENWCANFPIIQCREKLTAYQNKLIASSDSGSQGAQPAPTFKVMEATSITETSTTEMLNSAQSVATSLGCGKVQLISGMQFQTQCPGYSLAINCDDKDVCRPVHTIKQQQ
jgi:hypothetical protein